MVDQGNRRLCLLEAKATRTPRPEDAQPLARLGAAISGYRTSATLVHAPGGSTLAIRALRPGIAAIPLDQLPPFLDSKETANAGGLSPDYRAAEPEIPRFSD